MSVGESQSLGAILRRQTGCRLRYKSEDLWEWKQLLCTRAMGKEAMCVYTEATSAVSYPYSRSRFLFPDMPTEFEVYEGRNMGYAGRQNIYQGAIRKMVTQALEAQEEEYRKKHAFDTDDQMLSYLRSCAMKLKHTPWPEEITGGTLIAERFGSWEKALHAARLPWPQGENKPSTFLRMEQEEARQKEIYRQRRVEKKLLAQQRRIQQEAKRRNSGKKK